MKKVGKKRIGRTSEPESADGPIQKSIFATRKFELLFVAKMMAQTQDSREFAREICERTLNCGKEWP